MWIEHQKPGCQDRRFRQLAKDSSSRDAGWGRQDLHLEERSWAGPGASPPMPRVIPIAACLRIID